jgi:protein TonB
MYRPRPTPRDRATSIALVVAIHAGLAVALVNLSGEVREQLPEEVIEIFEVGDPPPPPPPVVEEIPEPEKAKPKEEEGAASARNIESRATPVVAPKPPIALPIPQPMPVTQTPNTGSERTQGASDVVGPGTGAGGQGTGTGSGGSGSGTGGGGTGIGTRPTVIQSTTLTSRDYPRGLLRDWPRGGRVFVAVRVQLDGRATDCKVNRSAGDPRIDAETCRLVEQKVRFRPAVDGNGRPYVSWYGYVQAPVNF